MATSKTRRVIEIDVTTSKGLQQGIRQVNSQLRSIEGNAKRTGREVKKMSRSFDLMRIAATAFVAIRIAKAITDISDTMILLGARINIVTENTVGVEKAFSDLFDIANLTRQSIEATGTLYARLGFATKALGLEHQQLLDIVQGVNNTLLLSGSSAQESASSIIQLSQAFSKGALDGDEFRSVSEGNVVLFGIMQEVLGKTAGELRQFSRDGKLTAEIMAQVLTSQQVRDLQQRVDGIPLTFGQAFTKIKNSFAQMARELEPLFTTIASWFDAFSQGFAADITIAKGYSEGILTAQELLIQGNGTLQQRLDLAEKVNIEFNITAELFARAKENEKLGITNQVAALAVTERELVLLKSKLIATSRILNNQDKQTKEAINWAARQERIVQAQITAQLAVKKALQDNITNVKTAAKIEKERLRVEVARGKLYDANKDRFEEIKKGLRTPLEILNATIAELQKLSGLGFDVVVLDAAATQAMVKYEEAIKKAGNALSEVEKNSRELGIALGQTLATGVGSFGDAIFDYMVGIETSFKQTITNILDDIGRLIVKITILNALKSGLSGSPVGAFLFPTANANGNAFDNGNISRFATGGVVDSPVLFPMANGTGLMGEAGPEAIMPLKRGPDGKLGVTAEGGNAAKAVTVSIENKGSSESEVVTSTATSDVNGTVINIILDDIRRGGPLRNALQSR